MSALAPLTARANEEGCCGKISEVIQSCDKALTDQDRVIDLKTRTIEAQSNTIAALDTRVAGLEKEKGGLFRSPWLYFGLGIVAGALLVRGR